MADKIRVLLADDQKLFTESMRTLIESYAEDIEIVAVATTGTEAVRLAQRLKPQVILMDVRMPECNGVEATRRILSEFPSMRIMMLSTFDEDEYVKEALHLGAAGYLLKDISPAELHCVNSCHQGRSRADLSFCRDQAGRPALPAGGSFSEQDRVV